MGRNIEHRREYSRAWHAANKEKTLERRRAWVDANREKVRAYHRKRYAEHKAARAASPETVKPWATVDPKKQLEYHRKSKYNLSAACLTSLLIAQNGACALCAEPFSEKGMRKMCVDHCHETGKVRGLLHVKCNGALGMFGDSVAGLERAAAYLRKGGVVEDIFA